MDTRKSSFSDVFIAYLPFSKERAENGWLLLWVLLFGLIFASF